MSVRFGEIAISCGETNKLTPKFAIRIFVKSRNKLQLLNKKSWSLHNQTSGNTRRFFNWAIYFAAELKLNNTRYLFNIYHLMVFDRYHQNLNHNKRHISFWRRGIHIRNDHRRISHSVILYIMLENFKMRTCVRANKRCWCAPFSINQMSYSIPRKLFHIVGFVA